MEQVSFFLSGHSTVADLPMACRICMMGDTSVLCGPISITTSGVVSCAKIVSMAFWKSTGRRTFSILWGRVGVGLGWG